MSTGSERAKVLVLLGALALLAASARVVHAAEGEPVPQDRSATAEGEPVPQDRSATAEDEPVPQDRSATAEDEPVPQDRSAACALLPRPAVPDRPRAARLYAARCAVCHGADGRGDGPAARFQRPRPRDFVEANYRLRSTPSGTLPTSDDLFCAITRGIPGTAMPPWGGLSGDDRWALVTHLESLSPRFAEEGPGTPLPAQGAPPATAARLARGAALYVELGCDRCHGADGRGRGVATADELRDSRGDIAHPFDLTRGWKTKSGRDVTAIHRALVTGLDGTPMPAYAEGSTDDDLWSLAHFIRALWLDL
jgi:mono/diheme cytochrome c family protein